MTALGRAGEEGRKIIVGKMKQPTTMPVARGDVVEQEL
jgi:hypothetical protein